MKVANSTWVVAPPEHALVVSSRPSSAEPDSSLVGPSGRGLGSCHRPLYCARSSLKNLLTVDVGKLNALVGLPSGPGPIASPRPTDFSEPRLRPAGPPDPSGLPNSLATISSPSTLPVEPVVTTVTVISTLPAVTGIATSSIDQTLPTATSGGSPTTPLFPFVRETTTSASATPGTLTTSVSRPFPTFLASDIVTVTATLAPPTITAFYSTAGQSRLSTTTVGSTPPSTIMEHSSRASQDEAAKNDHRTLVITLSSVLSVVVLVVIAIGVYLLCLRNRRARRRLPLFNRGITPIPDDEIASWKINKPRSEKSPARYTTRNPTTYGHKKASSQTPSLIQYHNPGKSSLDYAPHSPRSFLGRHSNDLPQSPQSAVLAKAPNARTGLTDQAVPGDDPFLPAPRRQPSRLHKLPGSPAVPQRPRGGSRSNSMRSFAEVWYGENMLSLSPRASSEVMPASTRGGSSRVYSTSTAPPRLSLTDDMMGGLSPPPPHRTEIGRALG